MERAHSENALSIGTTLPTHRLVHANSSSAVLTSPTNHQQQELGDHTTDDSDDDERDAHNDSSVAAYTTPSSNNDEQTASVTLDSSRSLEPSASNDSESAAAMTETAAAAPPSSSLRTDDDKSESMWQRPTHKLVAFALLLLDEFLVAHHFDSTAHTLKAELLAHKLDLSSCSAELWCEMHHSCRAALAPTHSSNTSSTLEQLLAFCIGGSNNSGSASTAATHAQSRRGIALDVQSSSSPVIVCASPKPHHRASKRNSAFSLMDAHVQMLRSPVVQRPSRRVPPTATDASPPLTSTASTPVLTAAVVTTTATSESVQPQQQQQQQASTAVHTATKTKKKPKRKHNTTSNNHGSSGVRALVPTIAMSPQQLSHDHSITSSSSSYTSNSRHSALSPSSSSSSTSVEPARVLAHEAQLKRERAAARLLERELRHIRLEKIVVEPTRSVAAKRLGIAASLTTTAHAPQVPTLAPPPTTDAYATDLVLERLGLHKRVDCALCQFSFLQVNLPYKVSFKCIMDVYAAWQFAPSDRETAGRFRPPLCYDAVHVCRLCAQIVFAHTVAAATRVVESPVHGRVATHQQQLERVARRTTPLATTATTATTDNYSSDPYALPPLFADDCLDERTLAQRQYDDAVLDEQQSQLHHHHRHRSGSSGSYHVASPAKAIVYAHQPTDVYMTPHEWSVIHSQRSVLRATVEHTTNGASS